MLSFFHFMYHNDPKFLVRHFRGNGADSDQTVPQSALFAIPSALFRQISP